MIKDYVVGIGLDALKDKLGGAYDQLSIKAELNEYVDRLEKLNYSCTREEEIDFQGLADYLCEQLPSEIETRIFSTVKAERDRAHRTIVAKAIAYASANTALAQKRVTKFVNDALNVLRTFWDRKLSHKLRHLAARITDDVDRIVENQNREQTNEIVGAVHQLINQHQNTPSLSLDNNIALLKEHNIGQVEEHLNDFIKGMSTQHDLYPYYGYTVQSTAFSTRLISTPLSAEAERMYPPHFKCSGRVFLGNKQVPALTPRLKQYADDHQLPITLIADEAQKFLGTIIDPQQCEVDDVIGTPVIIQPKEFPAAMPYSIIHNDVVIYKHILLRAEEKFEDGSFSLSNEEQSLPFLIRFRVHPATKSTSFSFHINGGSNRDQLRYREFLKVLYSGGKLVIQHLDTGKNLLEASCSESRPAEYMDNLQNEIDFLKNVISLEDYFDESIVLPERFPTEDVQNLFIAAALIQGKIVRSEWSEYEISTTLQESTKEEIQGFLEGLYRMSCSDTKHLTIFGRDYNLPCLCTWTCAKLASPDKIKALLDILDLGDPFKLTFIPGGDSGKGEFLEQLISYSQDVNLSNCVAAKR